MSILDKAYELKRQLDIAENSIEYSLNVSWGEDKEKAINKMLSLIKRVMILFTSNRLADLDPDVRDQFIKDIEIELDNELNKFPNYRNKMEEQKKGR